MKVNENVADKGNVHNYSPDRVIVDMRIFPPPSLLVQVSGWETAVFVQKTTELAKDDEKNNAFFSRRMR